MTSSPLPDLSRRNLLGAASAAGAAVGLGTLGLDEAAAAGRQGKLPHHVDVVVVGAGIAGLVAAREVARKGLSVLLVEARNRVGGRVLNHELKTKGATIESGGAFIGPTQTHIRRLAKELHVPTFKEYNTGNSVYVSSTLGRLEYSGTVPPDPTILADAAVVLTLIDQYASEIAVDAPWSHPQAREWDRMTLRDFIRSNSVVNPEGVANLIESWSEPGFGADPRQLSLLFVLWYVACSGDERHVGTFSRNSDTAGGAQERRFVGGSQLVPLRLAKQLGDIVALHAPVDKIVQRDHRVHVHTGRGVVTAKRVIVAAPPPMVLDLDWFPQLPTRRRKLLKAQDMGKLMKCDAVYKKPFWRDAGLSGFGVNDSGAVRVAFDNSPKNGEPGVLLAFVGGDAWRTYGRMSKAKRRKAVLEGFAAMFGDEALHPVEFVEHDWTKERWTGGGPTSIHHADGSFSTSGSVIRPPFGRVHWAGTETSTYWSGYMDGAVRSGERAAVEVVEKLR
ncbi:FAD-dependent oxidoreductase [soil metagenome]